MPRVARQPWMFPWPPARRRSGVRSGLLTLSSAAKGSLMSDQAQSYPKITPHLCVRNCSDAIAWYIKALGAQEVARHAMPDGKIMHATIMINDAPVFLNDEMPAMEAFSPQHLGGSPVTITLYVDHADTWWERAVSAGATVDLPLADQFWGDRYGTLTDPYGHQWAIAQHVKDMTPEEMQTASADAMAQMGQH